MMTPSPFVMFQKDTLPSCGDTQKNGYHVWSVGKNLKKISEGAQEMQKLENMNYIQNI